MCDRCSQNENHKVFTFFVRFIFNALCLTILNLHLTVLLSHLVIIYTEDIIRRWKQSAFLSLFHRGENQLEVSEDHVLVDLAVQRDLGHVSHSGMGTLWPRAFRHILLSGLGPNET